MAFYVPCHCFIEPDEEYGEHKGDDESVDSLLNICIIELKINLHTNLTLDAVPRKVLLQLVGKRKDSKVVSNIGEDEYPVERVEELEIGISIEYKSSVRVDN